mgnify:CR=1 FL=1
MDLRGSGPAARATHNVQLNFCAPACVSWPVCFCVLIWCGPWVCRGRVLWEGESRDLVRGYGSVICLLNTRVEQQLTTYTHAGSRSRHKNKVTWDRLARAIRSSLLSHVSTRHRRDGATHLSAQTTRSRSRSVLGGRHNNCTRAYNNTAGRWQHPTTSHIVKYLLLHPPSTILHLNSAALRAGRTVSERRLNQLIQQELYPKIGHRAYDGRS